MKRKKSKSLRQQRNPDNAFDTLNTALEQCIGKRELMVSYTALRTILRFAKYHRQWRLMLGYNDTGKVPLDGALLAKVDKKRIKYYAALFGIDPTALHESVHTHDAPGGGGNRTKKAARTERTLSRAGLKTTLKPRR